MAEGVTIQLARKNSGAGSPEAGDRHWGVEEKRSQEH